jgi:hypothetical protein
VGCYRAVGAVLAIGNGAGRGSRGSGVSCCSLLKRPGSGGRSHDLERGREHDGCALTACVRTARGGRRRRLVDPGCRWQRRREGVAAVARLRFGPAQEKREEREKGRAGRLRPNGPAGRIGGRGVGK